MSLDVCIKFKKRKMVNYNKTHVACGSTLEVHGDKEEFYQRTWNGNVTHNMRKMARHIPVRYIDESRGISYKGTLYEAVWRGDENRVVNFWCWRLNKSKKANNKRNKVSPLYK